MVQVPDERKPLAGSLIAGPFAGRIAGEGQSGPRSSRPRFAATAEALSGLRYLIGFPGGRPPRHGLSTGDTVAAMFGIDGIRSGVVRQPAATGLATTPATPSSPTRSRRSTRARRCSSSSVEGAGGCPFAPGATGNPATEDLAWVLDRDGVETGVEVDAVVETAHWLEQQLERTLPGALSRPGCPLTGM